MKQPEDNQTPLNAPASDATSAAPSGQSAVSKNSGNQPAGTTEAQLPSQELAQEPTQGDAPVPAPAATPPVKQNVDSLKQAAQLEHKPSTVGVSNPSGSKDCAPAGGPSPQSPELISKSKPAKKKHRKKRDNHVSVRLQDEELDVIDAHMEATGESQSDAIRSLIRANLKMGKSVVLAPKTPPEQLEDMKGELSKWRMQFSKVQSKLNIITPKSDCARYQQVVEWRAKSKELLAKIPAIEEVVNAALGAVSSLTPERIALFKLGIYDLQRWRNNAANNGHEDLVEFYTALLELIDDMGIKPKP